MLRFQRLTGCRPGEVCLVRPCDVDTSQDVWCYRPESHKTEHLGRERLIFLGPKAQDVLRPYLVHHKNHYCFVPSESERRRNARRREARQSPMTPSQAKRRPKQQRRRPPGNRYTVDSYRRATTRAITKANRERAERGEKSLPHWAPNQLRHSAATEIRRQFGLEAAQVALGHANADVSQIYAERDWALAQKVMREVG
jgi:integrase